MAWRLTVQPMVTREPAGWQVAEVWAHGCYLGESFGETRRDAIRSVVEVARRHYRVKCRLQARKYKG